MQIDLTQTELSPEPVRTQVCIVGGGIAGIVLAHRLAEHGLEVALLEAGGPSIQQSSTVIPELSGLPHHGLAEGQLRVFGGTSLRWGGQLLPLLDTAGMGSAWPLDPAELDPFYLQAESLLGVDHLSSFAEHFFPQASLPVPSLLSGLTELDGRLSKWTPFARRNLATTLGRSLLRDPAVHIYFHASVTDLLATADGSHIDAALVRTPSGATLRFEAARFIVAAGTVETVRLLLASRSASPQGVGNTHDQVGRNFHDHLTVSAATVTGPAREQVLEELRPWVISTSSQQAGPVPRIKSTHEPASSTLHSAKLVATAALCAQLDINPVLAHLTLEEPEDTGVAAVRALLRARQGEGLPAALRTHATRLPAAFLEAVRLAWAAKVDHRRYVSPRAQVKLYLNAQQDTPSASRITLSSNLDALGIPIPCVDWRVTDHELLTLRRFAHWLHRHFAAQGLEGIDWNPALFSQASLLADPTLFDDLPTLEIPNLDDARHAMGGACMGHDPRTSVVDTNLSVHGVDNLSIVSAATFPTGAAQLPTLPLMALALRLADRLGA
jgi:choline dehydrogenase-like flavoprotein